ncbi:MAG: glycosyltransferase family 4 protein [Planctomycetota bacterium]
MKVLLMAYKFPPCHMSGLEMGTDFMARELVRRGHQVHVVVTRRDRGQSFHGLQHGYRLWRLPVLPVPVLRSLWEWWAASLMVLWIRPDLFHGQALVPCGFLAGFWGRLLGCRSVVYLYGRDVRHPSTFLRETLGRPALTWCTVVLAATEHCRSAALEIKQRDIRVFLSGFEPPARWPQRERGKRILFVGRLDKVKGVDVLLKALPQIEGVGLDIVGEGPLRRELEFLAATLGVDSRVAFLGSRSNDDVLSLMARSAVLAVPSLEEPYGVVILEALSVGCPVVASRVGGIPEIIDSPDKGFLVEPGVPAPLAEALRKALHEADPSPEVVQGIRSRFTWRSRVDELEAHYAA